MSDCVNSSVFNSFLHCAKEKLITAIAGHRPQQQRTICRLSAVVASFVVVTKLLNVEPG